MNKLKYITIFTLLLAGMWSCDEKYEPLVPQGRIENISFAKDTFVFNEGAGTVQVPIVASKYVNYSTQIVVGIQNKSAQEDTNFVVLEKSVEMELGSGVIDIELKLIDDTIIDHESRVFTMSLDAIKGGGVPATTRQTCVVIIQNNDYEPVSTIRFDEARDTVREDGRSLVVPFHLTMAAEEDVTVTFALDKLGEYSMVSFEKNTSVITLKKGELKGKIQLNVANDDISKENAEFDLVIRDVQGALHGADSICSITVLEDDLPRTISFGELEEGELYREEAGSLEIPLVLTGGKAADRMINGSISLDSVFNFTSEGITLDDVTLETTKFTSAGDETLQVKVKVKNNDTFGEWGFKLSVKGVTAAGGVKILNGNLIVNVKDDERVLGFKTTDTIIDEGEPLPVYVYLNGGKAMKELKYKVEVDGNTTAESSQYTLPGTFLPIYAGNDKGDFNLGTTPNPSKSDKILKLRIIAEDGYAPGKIIYHDSQFLTVTIRNLDNSIGFANSEMSCRINQAAIVPINVASRNTVSGTLTLRAKAGTENGVDYSVKAGAATFGNGDDIIVPITSAGITNIEVTVTKITDINAKPLEFEIVDASGTNLGSRDINQEASVTRCNLVLEYDLLNMKTVIIADSVNAYEKNNPVTLLIDGKESTSWHSPWSDIVDYREDKVNEPYLFFFELDKEYSIGKMEMTDRVDDERSIGATFSISMDNVNWTDLGSFDTFFDRNHANKDSSGELIPDKPIRGKYVKITTKGIGISTQIFSELRIWSIVGTD